MKLLDKMYFYVQNKMRGYNEGYELGNNEGWTEGYDAGIIASRIAVIAKLEARDPKMSNEAFQLGYAHAIAVAKGEI